MKLIDRNGRLFGRINIIDLMVLLILLGAVGFYAYKQTIVNPQIAPSSKTYMVKVLVEEVRQVTANELKNGTVVKEADANSLIGTIRGVDIKPATRQVERADGQIVLSTIPEKFDLVLAIEAPAQVTNWTIRIANTDFRIGTTIKVAAQRFMVKGTVVGLEEKK